MLGHVNGENSVSLVVSSQQAANFVTFQPAQSIPITEMARPKSGEATVAVMFRMKKSAHDCWSERPTSLALVEGRPPRPVGSWNLTVMPAWLRSGWSAGTLVTISPRAPAMPICAADRRAKGNYPARRTGLSALPPCAGCAVLQSHQTAPMSETDAGVQRRR